MIFHTNNLRPARNSPILYDFSHKQPPPGTEFSTFVRYFTQTTFARHEILRFCMIFHTNNRRRALNSANLYDFSYKQAPLRTEFPDLVRYFTQTTAVRD